MSFVCISLSQYNVTKAPFVGTGESPWIHLTECESCNIALYSRKTPYWQTGKHNHTGEFHSYLFEIDSSVILKLLLNKNQKKAHLWSFPIAQDA